MTTAAAEAHTHVTLTPIEIGPGLWVLVPGANLDDEAAEELRSACIEAIDRGALTLVVDLGAVRQISLDALDVLASASSSLLARGGRLSLTGGHEAIHALAPEDAATLGELTQTPDEALVADRAASGGHRAA